VFSPMVEFMSNLTKNDENIILLNQSDTLSLDLIRTRYFSTETSCKIKFEHPQYWEKAESTTKLIFSESQQSLQHGVAISKHPIEASSVETRVFVESVGGEYNPVVGKNKELKIRITPSIQWPTVGFNTTATRISQSAEQAKLMVTRSGYLSESCCVRWESTDGQTGTVVFGAGVEQVNLSLNIFQSPTDDLETEIYVELKEIVNMGGKFQPKISEKLCVVTVETTIFSPKVYWEHECYKSIASAGKTSFNVIRTGFAGGSSILTYIIRGGNQSFNPTELIFKPGETLKRVTMQYTKSPKSAGEYQLELNGIIKDEKRFLTSLVIEDDFGHPFVTCCDREIETWRSDRYCSMKINRSGFTDCHTTVHWQAESVEKDGGDKFNGELTFSLGQMTQIATFELEQSPKLTEIEFLEFRIVEVTGDFEPKIGNGSRIKVNNNVPGSKFCLVSDEIKVVQSDYEFNLVVKRTNYLEGKCVCTIYLTDSHPGYSLLQQDQPRSMEITFDSYQESATCSVKLNEYPIDPLESHTASLSNLHLDSHAILAHLATVSGSGCPTITSPDRCNVKIDHDINHAVVSFSEPFHQMYQSAGCFELTVKRVGNLRGKTKVRCCVVNYKELSDLFQVALDASPLHDVTFEVGQENASIQLQLPTRPIKIYRSYSKLEFQIIGAVDRDEDIRRQTFPVIDEENDFCCVKVQHDIGTMMLGSYDSDMSLNKD